MAGMNPFPNVKFALVVAEMPKYPSATDPERTWHSFLTNVRNIAAPHKETTTIHDNIWLIPLSTEMTFLIKLIGLANDWNIPQRILFLNDEPDWIRYPKVSDKNP